MNNGCFNCFFTKSAHVGLLIVGALAWGSTGVGAWSFKQASIMSPWAQLVDTNAPLPEYPRPQLVRTNWMNLNGLWQFQSGAVSDPVPTNQTLAGEILVPFPMESALSGVMQHHARSWCRRTFTVPPAWSGQRILLHLDAVDWESEVFINGQSVGIHKGGYDPATYDITSYLSGSGAQELIVRVYDPTDAAGYARGKQTLSPGGIMYTAVSGIWQPVWLEPVPETSISNLKLVPDIDNQRLAVTVNLAGPTNGVTVNAVARLGTNVVGSISGAPGALLQLPVPNPTLWSPTNPFLYDLTVTVSNGVSAVESVESYFGMRKISLGTTNGFVKMLLNDQFVFQFGPLDQGFWPDGIYTAPTDDALKSDIEEAITLGYNMVRKHIKVERSRWYYWADKLGILVWQDMPSVNSYTGNPQTIDTNQFKIELTRMVTNLWNHPSIISWVVFNEGQGQHDTASLVSHVKSLDPMRLVNQASGGNFVGAGDILDWHSYPNPSCPASATQAVVCGEFGGVGLGITNHTWAPGWGYIAATNGSDLASKFEDFCFQLSGFVLNQGLSAAVYTEITDVEIELNGTMTYDRKVRKPDPDRIRAAIASVSAPPTLTTVVPTSQSAGQSWKFTTAAPATNWYATNFNDLAWTNGTGGFGANNPPNTSGLIRTAWNSADIWLRRTFNPGALSSQQISNLFFSVYNDEDVEIYLNGVLAGSATGYRTAYGLMSMNEAGRAAIKPNATNVLAVHCHQTGGGQYIDVGIVVRESSSVAPPRPAPPTPTGLRAAGGVPGVALGWDYSSNATGYLIRRATVSGGPYTNAVFSSPLNAFVDATGGSGTTYFYVVTATNAAGESVNSVEISATTVIPPTPAPVTWFKADALGGLNQGDFVSTWPDSSGNGFNAVQTNSARRPTFVTNAMNGLPAIRFNAASSNYLAFTRPVQDDFTLFCVFRSTQGLGTGTHFYQGAGLVNGEVANVVNDFGLSLNTNGYLLAGTGNPDVTAVSSNAGFNNGQPHIVTFKRTRNGGVVELFVDGTLQGKVVGGSQSLTAPARLVIGAQQTLINYFAGDVAEVKIYDAPLSATDRAAEENALKCKYGVGPGAPPGAPSFLSGTAGNRQVSLNWFPVVGASGYNVLWSSNSAGPFVPLASGIPATNFVAVNVANGVTNHFKLASVSACGVGPQSGTLAIFVPLPELGVAANADSLTLSWPGWANDWLLLRATNLATPVNWSVVTNPAIVTGGVFRVELPFEPQAAYFRLASP